MQIITKIKIEIACLFMRNKRYCKFKILKEIKKMRATLNIALIYCIRILLKYISFFSFQIL